MIGYIYKLAFTDGKYYIGSTIQSLIERMYEHKKYANPLNAVTRFQPLYNHWRKTGEPRLECMEEVHCESLCDIRYVESEYINLFNDDPNCLNCCRSYNTAEDTRNYQVAYRKVHYEELKAYDTEWHRERRAKKKP